MKNSSSSSKYKQCTYKVTLRRVCTTIDAMENHEVFHIVIEFVALGVQHAMRMCRIAICGPSGSTNFFFTLSNKRYDSKKKVNEHKMCVLTFSKTFVRNISQNSARHYHNVYSSSCKISIILFRFKNLFFSTDSRKKNPNMKTLSVGAELFRANGQTDMTKLIGSFHKSANFPKKETTVDTNV
jgi:hypothetical protein